jgi:hypothetical protein
VDDVREACEDHEEKQRRGQLSVSIMAEPPSVLDTLLRRTMKPDPQDREYKEANEALEEVIKRTAKRTPSARHSIRIRALYVDLNESGIEWDKPADLSSAEAAKCLSEAANDYAGQYDRLQLTLLREMEPKLAAGLEAWPDRPNLPSPVWPEVV